MVHNERLDVPFPTANKTTLFCRDGTNSWPTFVEGKWRRDVCFAYESERKLRRVVSAQKAGQKKQAIGGIYIWVQRARPFPTTTTEGANGLVCFGEPCDKWRQIRGPFLSQFRERARHDAENIGKFITAFGKSADVKYREISWIPPRDRMEKMALFVPVASIACRHFSRGLDPLRLWHRCVCFCGRGAQTVTNFERDK